MAAIKELSIVSPQSYRRDACFKCGICVNLPSGGRRRIDTCGGKVDVYVNSISECSVKSSGVKNLSRAEAEKLLASEETQSV